MLDKVAAAYLSEQIYKDVGVGDTFAGGSSCA